MIGADKMSDVTDWTDRTTCVLVGDGAGAAVVEAGAPGADNGIGPVLWGSVPEMGNAVRIEGTPPRFAQEGQSVYRWATTRLPEFARRACEKAGLGPEDLAAVVLHQANLRIVEPSHAGSGPSTPSSRGTSSTPATPRPRASRSPSPSSSSRAR